MPAEPPSQDVLPQLHHGEIVRNVVEFVPTGTVDADGDPEVIKVSHSLVVLITPECDLLSDYRERDTAGKSPNPEEGKLNGRVLPHAQCCDLLLYDEIRWPYPFNPGTWKRVAELRDERYHRVPADDIRYYGHQFVHPELYLDFKRVFSVPTDYLYAQLSQGTVGSCGGIPEPWINHLVQRCYQFQSRVCVPDPSDTRV
jgi:hypothetical protein